MPEPTERGAAAERMAAVSILVGIGAVLGGMGLIGLAALTGGLPGLPDFGLLAALLPGILVTLSGLGIVIRGVHLTVTLDTLANIRLLQEETHRARTQAAVYSHARREPAAGAAPAVASEAGQVVKSAPAVVAAAPQERPKVVTSASRATVSHMTRRTAVQTDQRASKAAPIKGKPFKPHPIFMARPPK